MVNKSKAKGTEWESRCVSFLAENGWPHAERRALAGSLDKGDVAGVQSPRHGPVVIECKAEKSITLAEYLKEVRAEIKNAGADIGFAWVKAPRKSIQDSYCVVPVEVMVELLK